MLSKIFSQLLNGVSIFFGKKKNTPDKTELKVEILNDQYLKNETLIRKSFTNPKKLEDWKMKAKTKHDSKFKNGAVFVLDFDGDVEASSVKSLREHISAVMSTAEQGDEVVLRLKSPGGYAFSYGYAAHELMRLRDAKINLTVCVDELAASGGYMMACVANRIVASRGAILGSIGVVISMPNFSELMKRSGITYKDYTAGDHKRSVGMFNSNTPENEEVLNKKLLETHNHFKDFVKTNRPSLDIEKVANGDYWMGQKNKELGLIDDFLTSEELLQSLAKDKVLYRLTNEAKKKSFTEALTDTLSASIKESISEQLSKSGFVKF